MTDNEKEGQEEKKMSIGIANIVDLFSRPRLFFSARLNLGHSQYLLAIIWINGIAAAMDRIDVEILRHEIDATRRSWSIIENIVTGSWGIYWAWCIGMGIIGGSIAYFIGGWWYRVRLRLSGSGEETGVELPRHVKAYSNLVFSIPLILGIIGPGIFHPNYIALFNSDELISTFLILFLFWSVAISYVGATTSFDLTPWKAKVWFLILPTLFYILSMGVLIWVVSLFS